LGVRLAVAGAYLPPLSTAIQRFKYQGRAELCAPLARLLSSAITQLALPSDVLFVPVPLHVRRLASRGYNQAALLATQLASQCGRGCRPRLLARARDTDRQVGKQRAERLENLKAAFQLRQRTSKSVVLVDDVITTGSTVRECAQALNSEGVKVAAIVALARARLD